MLEDNWKNRSKGMRCRTCIYFVVKESEDKPENEEPQMPSERGCLGRCRRHAPTTSGWPANFESDWCGDHKLDESKI